MTEPTTRPTLRIGWTVYAGLLTVFVLIGEAGNLSAGARVDPVAIAGWVLTLALLVATWGYALQRAIGNPRYWQAVFWIVLVATIVMLVPIALGTVEAILYTSLLLALVAPAYVAAYRYAYRSSALWNRAA